MEQEGVIKYQLDFQVRALHCAAEELDRINACRTELMTLGLLGQDPARYEGLGFGNISLRRAQDSEEFLISGSQTGAADCLTEQQLACVTDFDAEQNRLVAYGATLPSSEAMTHGVIYRLSGEIGAVVHVHSPVIWYHCDALQLPFTAPQIAYGTPAMAHAVAALGRQLLSLGLPLLFVMKGHQDGVLAAGNSLAECRAALLATLARSQALSSNSDVH